jgi:hypothetical protein
MVRQRLTNQAPSTSSPYQSGAHDWLAENSGDEPATKLGNCGPNEEISDIRIQDRRRTTLEWTVVAAMKLFEVLFAVTHREASRPGNECGKLLEVPNLSLQRATRAGATDNPAAVNSRKRNL